MPTAAEALELPILDQAQVVAGRGSLKQDPYADCAQADAAVR